MHAKQQQLEPDMEQQAGSKSGKEYVKAVCILSLCLFNLNTANIRWIIKKAREFQKNIFSALLTMPKPLTVWITVNCEKFWKRWEYKTTLPASWETCIQVKKQQLEPDMEQ